MPSSFLCPRDEQWLQDIVSDPASHEAWLIADAIIYAATEFDVHRREFEKLIRALNDLDAGTREKILRRIGGT